MEEGQISTLVKLQANVAREVEPGEYEVFFQTRNLSRVVAIALKSAVFLNNRYNIATADQLEFKYTISAVEYTAVLPTLGFYSIEQIIGIILPQIEAQSAIINPGNVSIMEVGDYTRKVEVSNTVSVITYGGGGLNLLLGNRAPLTAGATIAFQTLPDLNGLNAGQIVVSSKNPKTIVHSDVNRLIFTNSIGLVPVDAQFGELQIYTNPDIRGSIVSFDQPEDMQYIQFKVRDENGAVLQGQTPHLLIEIVIWR